MQQTCLATNATWIWFCFSKNCTSIKECHARFLNTLFCVCVVILILVRLSYAQDVSIEWNDAAFQENRAPKPLDIIKLFIVFFFFSFFQVSRIKKNNKKSPIPKCTHVKMNVINTNTKCAAFFCCSYIFFWWFVFENFFCLDSVWSSFDFAICTRKNVYSFRFFLTCSSNDQFQFHLHILSFALVNRGTHWQIILYIIKFKATDLFFVILLHCVGDMQFLF